MKYFIRILLIFGILWYAWYAINKWADNTKVQPPAVTTIKDLSKPVKKVQTPPEVWPPNCNPKTDPDCKKL